MEKEKRGYLTRLIAGVRKQAEKEYRTFEGDRVIPAKWLEVVLLCDEVDEILNKMNDEQRHLR